MLRCFEPMPAVDIIIPVYNTKLDYVRAALESVVAQTFADWQVWLVNDGSRADYSEQLEALVREMGDARIRYIPSENKGVTAARNIGIEASSAPLIAFLDSDDLWYPEKLSIQVEFLHQHPEVALLHAASDLLPGDDMRALRKVPARDLGVNGLSLSDACVRMLRSNYVGINTVILRREVGQRVGFFDTDFKSIEDKEMWCRWLLAEQRFHYMQQTLAVYRLHPNNSSKNTLRMLDGRIKLINKIDSALARGEAPWLRADWPGLRRDMLRHAHHEAAETYIEGGSYADALRHAAPWRSGVSVGSVKLVMRSLAGLSGLRA